MSVITYTPSQCFVFKDRTYELECKLYDNTRQDTRPFLCFVSFNKNSTCLRTVEAKSEKWDVDLIG